MKVNLVDFIYAFDNDTYVEVIDHTNDKRIFSGDVMKVIRMINRSDNEFYINLGRPYCYAEIKSGKLIVYPDIE